MSVCETYYLAIGLILLDSPIRKLTFTTIVQATIDTKSKKSVSVNQYPYPMALKNEMDRQIDEVMNCAVWIVAIKWGTSGRVKYRTEN